MTLGSLRHGPHKQGAGGWIKAVLQVLLLSACAAGTAKGANPEPLIEAGRRLYEEGILPDGSPLRAVRPEGFTLSGKDAACAACHRTSGMGTTEGLLERTVLVPPVAGPLLYAPARFYTTPIDTSHHYVPNAAWARALTRPAYDKTSLGKALREGVDPAGQPLLAPMPRYELDNAALAALDAYLRQLSSTPAPGDDADALHLATVITPDAPASQTEAVLGVLHAWSDASQPSGKPWRLHVWRLTGPPEQWPVQLQALYRERPVFAVLSGSGAAHWSAVHDFCESHALPCLLPALEVAPERTAGRYSVYYSPGTPLEARLIAHHLRAVVTANDARTHVVQIHSDDSGRQGAVALREALLQAGLNVEVVERRLDTGSGPEAADVFVLWLRPEALRQLALSWPAGPVAAHVFLSALLAPPEAVDLPDTWRKRVTYASLFDDLSVQGEVARLRLRQWLQRHRLDVDEASLRAAGDAYTAAYLFSRALAGIRAQAWRRPQVALSREHVLETLEALLNKYSDGTGLVTPDSHVAFYGRMSLGPGQRMAVRGGTLLRYQGPEAHSLTAASERIVP